MTNENIGKAMFISGIVSLLGLVTYMCPLIGVGCILWALIFFGAILMRYI